jgi:hypothetical protein
VPKMTPRNAPLAFVAVLAGLLAQACVQYNPVAAYPPPPQSPPYAAQNAGEPPSGPAAQYRSPASTLDQLLEPIALYPDPLIALILPAATAPSDVSAAAAYLVQYGDMTRIDSQPWDQSVRSLSHYPAVITWMADNLAWTQTLGAAFLSSPAEVTESIQRLRARAMAAGALASTPQQLVTSEDGGIEILPGQPDSIYVPAYDIDVVYSDEPYYGYGGPFIDFGAPCPVGPWLTYCLDWRDHGVWVGGWGAWHGPGGWHRPHFGRNRAPPGFQPWHPRARSPRPRPPGPRVNPVPHPRPMRGAPNPPPARFKVPANQASPQPRTPGAGLMSPKRPAPAVVWQGSRAPAAPSVSGAAAVQPAPRSYEYAPRQAAAESRYTPPERGPRAHESAPSPARAQAAAPSAHSAPAYQSAPAATRGSASTPAPSSNPRNH